MATIWFSVGCLKIKIDPRLDCQIFLPVKLFDNVPDFVMGRVV